MTRLRLLGLVGGLSAALLLALTGAVLSQDKKEKEEEEKFNLIYVPTDEEVVEKMFEMAKVKKGDVVFDLGCGDGRIVCMAAKKFGTKGVGIDLNPERIKDSLATVKKYGVKDLVDIRLGDALKVKDLDRATVVCLYMLPEFMVKLEPIAKKTLKPGTRIVSHDYKWSDNWPPDETVEFKGPRRTHTLYLWTVKGNKEKG
jgi:SAM-dependent methyltransferase